MLSVDEDEDLNKAPTLAAICANLRQGLQTSPGDNFLVRNFGCAMSVAQCAGWAGILRDYVETVAWRALEPSLFLLDRAKLISVG